MKDTANAKSVRRIETATREFIARCDEITDFAKDPAHRLSERFSPACILRFNETGIGFITAIAESESVQDLVAARKTFKLAGERVMRANRAIISRLGADHHVVDGVMCCEETFFDLLARADPTVRILTGLAKSHRTVIRIALTAAMTNVRKQLERIERKDEVTVRSFALPALQQIVDAVKGRPDKAWAMSFMRSLYGSGKPEFKSCRKVVNFVRTCKDESSPYYDQCTRIQSLVRKWARKEKGGDKRIWNTFAQELKPSHGKCRRTKISS